MENMKAPDPIQVDSAPTSSEPAFDGHYAQAVIHAAAGVGFDDLEITRKAPYDPASEAPRQHFEQLMTRFKGINIRVFRHASLRLILGVCPYHSGAGGSHVITRLPVAASMLAT